MHMFSIQELRFAQNYPFSSTAKRVVKESDFSLEEVPNEILARAKVQVVAAAKNSPIEFPAIQSREILLNEVLAFPVAKILVALTKKEELARKFVSSIASNAKASLDKEGNETLFRIAQDLEVKFHLSESRNFFVELPITEYLKASPRQDFMKLVNQNVSKGNVFLGRGIFVEFIAGVAEEQLRNSFPKDLSGLPKHFLAASKELRQELASVEKRVFDNAVLGSVKPDLFPPCIAKVYADILRGKNLNHAERFNLATFLVATGMPAEQIIELYKNTPNFDRKVTAYQVTRLAGKQGGTKYHSSSCSKMQEYNLRLPECPCNTGKIKHPMQYYRRQVVKERKQQTQAKESKQPVAL